MLETCAPGEAPMCVDATLARARRDAAHRSDGELRCVNLSSASLLQVNVAGARLEGATLQRVDVFGAHFDEANL